MARPLSVLLIDPSAQSRREVGEALHGGGLAVRSIAVPRQALAAARVVKPEVLLVNSAVRGEVLEQVLDSLAPDATFAGIPIALLCADTAESRFCGQLRTGVVLLLQQPFYAPRHLGELRALPGLLGQRSGSVSGNGDSEELAQLVEHLRRTRRSGVLVFNAQTPEQGTALFARGKLKTAEHLDRHGVEALLSMVASARAGWSFSEVGAGEGESVIDLPATMGDQPLAPAEEDVPPAVGAPALPILFVDDDEALCRMFGLLFRKHGFEVDTATDGYAGHEAALARRYEIVVADLNMPRMDGWGMLRMLRDDLRTREVPVAFLSCHDDYRETLRALESGAQAYFSKATRLDALVEQIRKLLEPRQTARRLLASEQRAALSPGHLGPQWLLRELARAQLSGTLEAKDSWAQYRLGFRQGIVVCAFARAGRHEATAQKALNAFVASRGAEGQFLRGEPSEENLSKPLEDLLAEAAAVLNDNERRIRDGLLVHASEIEINAELYALYAEVGPRQWLETARLICEEHLPPREVIARVEASPLDVEETLRDLVRRGVVRLSA